MRYLPLLLFALSGCGMDTAGVAAQKPKPAQKVEYDEPKPLTDAEFADLQAKARSETVDAAIARYDALSLKRIDGLSETVGNLTSEVEGVKEELKANRQSIDALSKLLTVSESPSLDVPRSVPVPAPVDAPPVESAGKRLAGGVTFNGSPIDVATWLKRKAVTVEIVGDVDAHLRDHGYDGDFSGLTRAEKIHLHSLAHASGVPVKSREKVVTRTVAIPQPASNCPNGNCARPQYYYPQTTQRWSLFGGRRR